MIRVLTYNILLGGTRRVDQLAQMMRASQADVIGLVEATDAHVVEVLAERLGMQYRLTGSGSHQRDWQMAVLSRLPIVSMQIYTRPAFARKMLLEVTVEETTGQQISLFVIHQPAGFRKDPGSRRIRRAEIREILDIMSSRRGSPHLLLGDFNTIAPRDRLSGSSFIRYRMREFEKQVQKNPARFSHVSPARKRQWERRRRLMKAILDTGLGSFFVDSASKIYGLGGIDLLLRAGYKDSFRYLHPKGSGYTFPAAVPSCRIDYIFVSPELARRLVDCEVFPSCPEVVGMEASDHLPVFVEFL